MNTGDQQSLREAAGSVETAMMRILEKVGEPGGAGTGAEPRMTPEEYGALREIASGLRAANTRLWELCGGDYHRPGVFP
jgi:hypothetical protein